MTIGLERLLGTKGEAAAQRYLAKHPEILLGAFTASGFPLGQWLLPKFRFGSDFVSDFVVLSPSCQVTGYFDVVLVELESPMARIFTKQGRLGKQLNDAMRQLDEWLVWVCENRSYFVRSLQKAITIMTGAGFGPESPQHVKDILGLSARVVIGRRSMLSSQDNKRRAAISMITTGQVAIVPYDRLVDTEARLRRLDRTGGA